jgi:hypothetical protein
MAQFFRIMGRLTGYVLKSHILDKAVNEMAHYVLSQVKLADIRLKLKLLKQKRNRHLNLLGRTVYRLDNTTCVPLQNSHIEIIVRVLREIDLEIEQVEAELLKRKQQQEQAKEQTGRSSNL